jgi:hypothetical protein
MLAFVMLDALLLTHSSGCVTQSIRDMTLAGLAL